MQCVTICVSLVCSTQQSVGPGLGDDLLDLILNEGNLDDAPLPSEDRSSPDPMLELFSMPVKCSSPTHSSVYSNNAPPTDPQAPPPNPQATCTNTQASANNCSLVTDTLDWLLSQPQLDKYYLNDQFWLDQQSPSNSSAVSSVPSPQQPDSPLRAAVQGDNSVQQSPQSSASELPEQYGCLHDHTYAAMEPKSSSITEEEKYLQKRIKNNLASQVSRAKRKRKYSSMFTRLDELEEENKRLKQEVSIAEVEAAKLRKLIVGKLNTST